MATTQSMSRNGYDRFRTENDDEPGSTYACDCGQEYVDEETLKRHQQNNCKNRAVLCSFCQETFPSSTELRDHLLLCGNKTDQCPNCRQLIRRSHFAYHYENNCAPIDEIETPPPRPKSRSNPRLPTNSNKPVSREDVPSDNYSENSHDQNSSMYHPRANGRIQSPVSNLRNSPGNTICEYCHNQCAQKDYKTHRDNCLQNPTNINYKPPQRTPLRPNQNQNNSNGIVHLPCEICNEPVDLPNWSNHIQNCRERQMQRLAARARSMSQEPVTEQLPCEYCQRLFPANRLDSHQTSCPQNPENMDSAARLVPRRSKLSRTLPTRSKTNKNQPESSNGRSPNDRPDVHYHSIDIDQTHAANRSRNNNRPSNNQHLIRGAASNEALIQPEHSFHGTQTYDNEPMRPNIHRSHENLSLPLRPRPSNSASQRSRSSFDNLRDIEDNQDPSSKVTGNRLPYYNDPKHRHRPHHGHEVNVKVIDNRPDRAFVKRRKVPWWKELFGCAGPTRNDEDN